MNNQRPWEPFSTKVSMRHLCELSKHALALIVVGRIWDHFESCVLLTLHFSSLFQLQWCRWPGINHWTRISIQTSSAAYYEYHFQDIGDLRYGFDTHKIWRTRFLLRMLKPRLFVSRISQQRPTLTKWSSPACDILLTWWARIIINHPAEMPRWVDSAMLMGWKVKRRFECTVWISRKQEAILYSKVVTSYLLWNSKSVDFLPCSLNWNQRGLAMILLRAQVYNLLLPLGTSCTRFAASPWHFATERET